MREYGKIWEYVDVLITADPEILNTKPNGKISIKVINHYNKNCQSDYTVIDLKEILDDRKLLEKILNTQTIDFEDI